MAARVGEPRTNDAPAGLAFPSLADLDNQLAVFLVTFEHGRKLRPKTKGRQHKLISAIERRYALRGFGGSHGAQARSREVQH